jgi:hypothetical protein
VFFNTESGSEFKFVVPHVDMCPYINLNEFLREPKVLQVD